MNICKICQALETRLDCDGSETYKIYCEIIPFAIAIKQKVIGVVDELFTREQSNHDYTNFDSLFIEFLNKVDVS